MWIVGTNITRTCMRFMQIHTGEKAIFVIHVIVRHGTRFLLKWVLNRIQVSLFFIYRFQ